MIIPSDFFFAQPQAAYLFLAIPLLIPLFAALFSYRKATLESLGRPEIVATILRPRSTFIYFCKCSAFILAWAAATFALMEPQGNGHYIEEGQRPLSPPLDTKQRRISQELLLLIDTSSSMSVADSHNGMTRLDYAKDIADELVSRLNGESVSLYAFTSEVTALSPATMDYLFIRLMLRQMGLNEGDVGGTDIVKAVQDIHKEILSLPLQRVKSLILISDGEDTSLEIEPAEAKEQAISSLLHLIDDSKTVQLHIHTIGMGSQKGAIIPDVTYQGRPVYSALQDEILRRLARRTEGLYLEANSSSTPEIADRLVRAIQKDAAGAKPEELYHAHPQTRNRIYDRYFQIPLSISLLLLLFAAAWPEARKQT